MKSNRASRVEGSIERNVQPDRNAAPANLAAERVVLGVLIEDDALVPEVIKPDAGLRAGDFVISDHQRIFRAILALQKRGCPVDYVSVAEELGNREEGYLALSRLVDGVVVHDNHLRHHVKIVVRKSQLRQILELAEWLDGAVNESSDPEALIAEAIKKLEQIRR